MFPFQKLAACRLADRSGDVVGPNEALVTEYPSCLLQDLLDNGSRQLRHVVAIAGDGLGDERDAPLKIRDNQGAVPGGLVLPGPQLVLAVPGPARPQCAVYQRDRVPGGLARLLRASSAVGRSTCVALSTSGVRKVMYRDTVDWSTSKMSAHTSSMMFCRRYPQVTTRASRRDSSRGRPSPSSHARSSNLVTRHSNSSSCLRPVLTYARTATASPSSEVGYSPPLYRSGKPLPCICSGVSPIARKPLGKNWLVLCRQGFRIILQEFIAELMDVSQPNRVANHRADRAHHRRGPRRVRTRPRGRAGRAITTPSLHPHRAQHELRHYTRAIAKSWLRRSDLGSSVRDTPGE